VLSTPPFRTFCQAISESPRLKFVAGGLTVGVLVVPLAILMTFGLPERIAYSLLLVLLLPVQYLGFCCLRTPLTKAKSERDYGRPGNIQGAKPSDDGLIPSKVFGIPVYVAPLFWSVALASILVAPQFFLHQSNRLSAMLPNLVWWGAIALEAIILERGVRRGLLSKYPLFFSYISCVLLTELIRFSCYSLVPRLYQSVYWGSEFVISLARYAVLIGIYAQFLKDYPGTKRLARVLLLSVASVMVATVAVSAFYGGFGSPEFAAAILQRDLPYVEVPLLLALLWLRHYYRISMGRNLCGLMFGYGFFVGTLFIRQGILFLPSNEFSLLVRRFLPTTYLVTLSIWCAALWSYGPDRVQPKEEEIERESKKKSLLALWRSFAKELELLVDGRG